MQILGIILAIVIAFWLIGIVAGFIVGLFKLVIFILLIAAIVWILAKVFGDKSKNSQ